MLIKGDDKLPQYCILVYRDCPGKCLHLDCGRTSNGTKIHLWDIIDESHPDFLNQVWILDGLLIRSAKDPTKVIHKEGVPYKHQVGTVVHLWKEVDVNHKDHSNQEWVLHDDGSIVCMSNPTWGFNLDWNRTSNGTKILIHPHHHKFEARFLKCSPAVKLSYGEVLNLYSGSGIDKNQQQHTNFAIDNEKLVPLSGFLRE